VAAQAFNLNSLSAFGSAPFNSRMYEQQKENSMFMEVLPCPVTPLYFLRRALDRCGALLSE